MPRPTASAATKTVRRDPRPSALDATQPILALANKDPKRVYKLVYKADQQHGIEYYEYQGYEIETGRDGGPQWAMGKTAPQQPMERLGHVLMSCSRKRHEEIMQEGAFGDGGLRMAKEQERLIFSKNGRAPGTDGEPERPQDEQGENIMDWDIEPVNRMVVEEQQNG